MADVRSTTSNLELIKYSRGHPVTDTDLATNMDTLDAAVMGSVTKVSTTAVTLASTGQTTLYTVPTGKIFIPVLAVIRVDASANTATVTLGRQGTATDFLGTQTLLNISTGGDMGIMMPVPNATPVTLKTYAAAVIFEIDVTVAGGGATNYVDLFGYLVDA